MTVASPQKPYRRSPGSSNRGSGICSEYATRGSCKHGSMCKYKHERPRHRSNSSKGSRSSSRSSLHSSRSRRSSSGSSGRKDKSQVPCRYFKKGNCRRGDSCPFKHEASSSSAAAPTRERAGSPSAKPKRDRRERYACVVIKDEYWEVSESGNVVTRHHLNGRNALFDPSGTKSPFPVRMLSDTRRTRYDQEDYDSSCIKGNWRTHNPDKSTDDWTGKSIFRLKSKHQVAMSSHRKKVFKVSFDRKVKTRTFQVEDDMVRHQHIKQSKSKLYPSTSDCPKPWEADTLEAIRCAKSLSETMQVLDFEPKCGFECDRQPL